MFDPIRGPLSRRDLLAGIAAGTVVSPFLPRSAMAVEPGPAPRNLLLVYHPNGLEVGWEPTGTERSFTLSPVLAPLERHREHLVIMGGVRGGISNEVLAHNQGMVSMWTGSTIPASEGFARHRSVDQIAADVIGVGTPFRSLELGVQSLSYGLSNTSVMIYGDNGVPLPPEDDPDAAFQRVFASSVGDPEAVARARQERRSVLDFVKGRLGRVADVYGAESRARIEAHTEAIRGLEQRLDGLSTLTCDVTERPHGLSRSALLRDGAVFGDLAALQSELIAAAFSCGATRVASLQLSHSTSAAELPGLGLPAVHTVMHAGTGPEKQIINTWFAAQLGSVLDSLKAVPGSGGGTLLDETLVVWNTEMAVGNHLNERIPVILAGGGAFEGNRWLWLDEPPRHTRLLLSVLHALGIRGADTLGDFPEDRGPIEELWA